MEDINLLQELVYDLSSGIPPERVLSIYFEGQGHTQDLDYYMFSRLGADNGKVYALLAEVDNGSFVLTESGDLNLVIVECLVELGDVISVPPGELFEILRHEFEAYLTKEWLMLQSDSHYVPQLDMQAVMQEAYENIVEENGAVAGDESTPVTDIAEEITGKLLSIYEQFKPAELLPIGKEDIADVPKSDTSNLLNDLPDDHELL